MDKIREALEAVNRYINDGSPLPPAGDPYYEVDRLVNEALFTLTQPQPEAREEDIKIIRECLETWALTEAEESELRQKALSALSRLAVKEGRDTECIGYDCPKWYECHGINEPEIGAAPATSEKPDGWDRKETTDPRDWAITPHPATSEKLEEER